MEEKKCLWCKKVLVGNKKIPLCQSCRDKGKNEAAKWGGGVVTLLTVVGGIKKIKK